MKGIILAGGSGTRLYPLTKVTSKQLLPVYDKPMIYYPLSVLMTAGLRDILIISTPQDLPRFKELLGNGKELGISLSYAEQSAPKGLADGILIAEKFVFGEPFALILGDNIFVGKGLKEKLKKAVENAKKGYATVFVRTVENPSSYGVVELDDRGMALSIEEKPKKPKSNLCVTGLYVYDRRAVDFAKKITPSLRGELEITDLNRQYLASGALKVERLGKGYTWLDTGTHERLLAATNFVKSTQTRRRKMLGCIEEISYRSGWITRETVQKRIESGYAGEYGAYLKEMIGKNGEREP